jgi:hypothetical protein
MDMQGPVGKTLTATGLSGRGQRKFSRLLNPSRTDVFLSTVIDDYQTSKVRKQSLKTSPVKDTAGRGIVPNVRVAAAGFPKGVHVHRVQQSTVFLPCQSRPSVFQSGPLRETYSTTSMTQRRTQKYKAPPSLDLGCGKCLTSSESDA